jgi:hypothetical protein
LSLLRQRIGELPVLQLIAQWLTVGTLGTDENMTIADADRFGPALLERGGDMLRRLEAWGSQQAQPYGPQHTRQPSAVTRTQTGGWKMPTLYVQEQGASVRKKDNQIVVTKNGQMLREVPLAKLDQVVLMGRGVQMSTALLVDLVVRGVPVTLTNQYDSRHYATLTAGPSRFGDLRTEQMRFVNAPDRARDLARAIVEAKLANQRDLHIWRERLVGCANGSGTAERVSEPSMAFSRVGLTWQRNPLHSCDQPLATGWQCSKHIGPVIHG